ncbi:MAG: hypothetical protein AAF740_09630, partial [Bacteroidota bacterium]
MYIKTALSRKLLSLSIIALLLSTFFIVQAEPVVRKSLNKERWEELREELKYKPSDKSKRRTETFRGVGRTPDWFTGILYMGAFLLIGTILFLIIKYGVGRYSGKLNNTGEIEAQLDTEDIRELDLDQLLEQGLAAENYRLGVRIFYLKAIKKLTESAVIKWKKDFTNREYLRQMRNHASYDTFAACT